jgi:hypothetical protein
MQRSGSRWSTGGGVLPAFCTSIQHADWVDVEKRHFKTAYAPKEIPS